MQITRYGSWRIAGKGALSLSLIRLRQANNFTSSVSETICVRFLRQNFYTNTTHGYTSLEKNRDAIQVLDLSHSLASNDGINEITIR